MVGSAQNQAILEMHTKTAEIESSFSISDSAYFDLSAAFPNYAP
jgi:hypothetical protein